MGDGHPNKAGQPTKYRAVYCRQAEHLCLLGATTAQLADFFEVCNKTIENWGKVHPKFLRTIKGAKNEADTRVERALFERAIGYKHRIVPKIKQYPPETAAAMSWLQNRQPDRWRNVKHMDLTTKGEKLSGVPPTDAELLEIAMSGK